MSFEQQIQQAMFNKSKEKTFIDKILAKDDVRAVQELIKKPSLGREDLLELLYLLSSTESKLLNYSKWDRYVILKFFVWIREFIKVAELIYDYKDDIEERKKETGQDPLTPRAKMLLSNAIRKIEHNAKFLIDLYFNIGRTTLSLGASGFMEVLNNKFEISYPELNQGQQIQEKQAKVRR